MMLFTLGGAIFLLSQIQMPTREEMEEDDLDGEEDEDDARPRRTAERRAYGGCTSVPRGF